MSPGRERSRLAEATRELGMVQVAYKYAMALIHAGIPMPARFVVENLAFSDERCSLLMLCNHESITDLSHPI